MRTVVTGVGLALPGVGAARELFSSGPAGSTPVDPVALLGPKGLRYKDRATQLAYCAATAALRDAGLLDAGGMLTVPGATIGVVASSNYGNVDTVCRTADTIAEEGASGTHPMDLPNASSNVIASSTAIRFGLHGPNVMVCNGATSGLDAVYLAMVMVAAHRASRVLVVGVEPDNPTVRKFVGGAAVDGAAALVVEDPAGAALRAAPVLAEIGGYLRAPDLAALLGRLDQLGPAALWQEPEGATSPRASGVPHHDLSRTWGVTSGALGVLQCAAAAGWFAGGGAGPVYAVTGHAGADAAAAVVLRPPARPPAASLARSARLTDSDATLPPAASVRPAGASAGALVLRQRASGSAGRMLLLHGLGNSATAWDGFVAEVRAGREIWAAELPWRGDGEAEWCYHRDPVDWVADAMDGLPGPADVVVAHSFSANTLLSWLDAALAGGADPLAGGRPRGLVLVSPFFRDRPEEFDWATLTRYVDGFHLLMADGIRAHLNAAPDLRSHGRRAALRHDLALLRQELIGPYTWSRFFVTYLRTPWLRTRLITVPCLVVAGEQDTAASPAEAATLAARLPNATLRVMPGCGHFPMIEQPTRFAAVVDEFIQSLDEEMACLRSP